MEYASLQQFLNTLLAQFNLAERRGGPPGFITVNELLPALQASGFNLTPNSVTNFAKRLVIATKYALLTHMLRTDLTHKREEYYRGKIS